MLAWLLHRHLLLEGAPGKKWHTDFSPWHLQMDKRVIRLPSYWWWYFFQWHDTSLFCNASSGLQRTVSSASLNCKTTLPCLPPWHQLCFKLLCSEPWDFILGVATPWSSVPWQNSPVTLSSCVPAICAKMVLWGDISSESLQCCLKYTVMA